MLRIKDDTQGKYVPLKRVNIDATIRSFGGDVKITQIFVNNETTPIEAVYCFPIEEQAAIYSFIARIDDREIIAQLKEKKEAQREYNEALRKGHGGYLLEQDEKSQDNFIINVGALPPGKECEITISYVTELDLVENGTKIRLVVPTTIAPRYNPEKGGISSPSGTNSKYVQSSPYTIDFQCQVDKIGISRISSTSHPIDVNFSEQDFYIIKFSQDNTHLDRDILLDIELAENRSNTIVAVESGAIMASFLPNEEDCRMITNNDEITNEFIFIVDCSGSMEDENKIGSARQAMLLFLKSLPLNCHFNIIRFGSDYKSLFENITAIYNEENARQADELIKKMRADLGGTELLRPLQWLEKNPPGEGRARQIFLLTDGEISNVDQVLDLCRSMVTSSRIFSFGLGHSPSRSLVKGLARTTNGRFVFIPPNTNVDVHVGEQLQKALQPCITNIQVNWNLGATSITNVPTKIPPVYTNDRLIVYALSDDKTIIFEQDYNVELTTEKHRIGQAKLIQLSNVKNNDMIGKLAAKTLIFELQHSKLPSSTNKYISGSLQSRLKTHEESATSNEKDEVSKETIKKRIIELSLKHNILSPYTAFVGVEKRINGNNENMVLREVPIQISADDQHLLIQSQMHAPLNSAMFLNCMSLPTSSMAINACATSSTFVDDDEDDYDDDNDDDFCPPLNAKCMANSPDAYSALPIKIGAIPKMVINQVMCDSDSSDDDLFASSDSKHSRESKNSETDMRDSNKKSKEDMWPTNDEDILRYLIDKQKFDGCWDLDSKSIEKLTGKALTQFEQTINEQVLITAIIVSFIEKRFASLSSMWYGIVQKARKRLFQLLGNDTKKVDSLLENIRQQI